jgi:hypothetical protein
MPLFEQELPGGFPANNFGNTKEELYTNNYTV